MKLFLEQMDLKTMERRLEKCKVRRNTCN